MEMRGNQLGIVAGLLLLLLLLLLSTKRQRTRQLDGSASQGNLFKDRELRMHQA